MEGGVKCIKYLMFAFNLLFVITGITLIAAAAVIQISFSHYLDFLGDGWSSPVIFISVGCVIFVVSFFGCCGAVKESNCMMMTFALLLTIIFLLEIGAGVAGYIFLGKLDSTVKPLMEKALNNYGNENFTGFTETWDYIQHKSHCCGISEYKDWNKSEWHTGKSEDAVPDSCCIVDTADCGLNPTLQPNATIYTEGCLPKFVDNLRENGSLFVGVAIGLSAIQLLGIIFSCLLAKSIRTSYEAV